MQSISNGQKVGWVGRFCFEGGGTHGGTMPCQDLFPPLTGVLFLSHVPDRQKSSHVTETWGGGERTN